MYSFSWTEIAQEIATLRKEAQAFKAVRTALRSNTQNTVAAKIVFQKVLRFPLEIFACFNDQQVFNADIKNLLCMTDMWRSRSPPTPLDFDSIMDGSFDLNGAPSLTADTVASSSGSDSSSSLSFAKLPNGRLNRNGNIPLGEGLKDQRALTLKDNLELFVSG